MGITCKPHYCFMTFLFIHMYLSSIMYFLITGQSQKRESHLFSDLLLHSIGSGQISVQKHILQFTEGYLYRKDCPVSLLFLFPLPKIPLATMPTISCLPQPPRAEGSWNLFLFSGPAVTWFASSLFHSSQCLW